MNDPIIDMYLGEVVENQAGTPTPPWTYIEVTNAGNNVTDGVNPQDAATVNQLNQLKAEVITYADALNLIATATVVVGKPYQISDRRDMVLRWVTITSFSGYGSMIITANEYENTVEESILVEYDLPLDLIYKITDVRRNVYDFFLNFSSLASFLTSVRYGNTGVIGNVGTEQFNIGVGSGPFFIANNNNEWYASVNPTVWTTFSDNYSDRSSTVVCDTGTIAGTRAMQSSQALAISGTIDSTVDMSSIIAVTGSGYSLLDKVSSGSSISIINWGSVGSTISDSSVMTLRDAFANVAIVRSGANYDAFGTNTLRNAEILGQTVFVTSSNNDHTNIFARGSCYIECKTANTIYSDNTLYNATTILRDDSTLLNSTISNGTVTLYWAGVGSYLTSNYVGNIDILSDGVLNDCLIENCAFPGNIVIGAGWVEIHNNRRAVPWFSNFKTTLDLDTFAGGNVDLAGLFLYGDVICTSANPTYTINTFANFNTNHGVRFRPAPWLQLTVIHGTWGGQPRNEASLNVILEWANWDYIEYTYNPDYLEVFQTWGFNYWP